MKQIAEPSLDVKVVGYGCVGLRRGKDGLALYFR